MADSMVREGKAKLDSLGFKHPSTATPAQPLQAESDPEPRYGEISEYGLLIGPTLGILIFFEVSSHYNR